MIQFYNAGSRTFKNNFVIEWGRENTAPVMAAVSKAMARDAASAEAAIKRDGRRIWYGEMPELHHQASGEVRESLWATRVRDLGQFTVQDLKEGFEVTYNRAREVVRQLVDEGVIHKIDSPGAVKRYEAI